MSLPKISQVHVDLEEGEFQKAQDMSTRMRGKQSTVADDEEEELDLGITRPDLVGREKSVFSFVRKTFSFPMMDQLERW